MQAPPLGACRFFFSPAQGSRCAIISGPVMIISSMEGGEEGEEGKIKTVPCVVTHASSWNGYNEGAQVRTFT